MAEREVRVPILGWVSPRAAWLLAPLLLLGVIVADWFTPAGIVVPISYGLPLVACAALRRPRVLWGMTALAAALTFGIALLQPPVDPQFAARVALLNRGMAVLSTLIIAGLLHVWIVSEQLFGEQTQTLAKQNEALEAINQELGQREEEVVRQNEELQSQTEELERQSEELRLTNEELAQRERTLEQLLELSRSLSAELSRDDMLRKICEALGVLTDGLASAILIRQDDRLEIPCYHGFGPEGLEAESVPFQHSFSALIMSLGQTGYLEDVQLRPDLVFPKARRGEPVRSVLSAPLRVRGACVGTIEIYAAHKQAWGEAQISMLESLAAQASVSLQNAQLVETIRQERRRFEAAFRTVPFGLAVADDPAASQVRLNPAAAALLNVPVDENIALSSPTGLRLKRNLYRGDQPLREEELPLVRALRGEEVHGEELELVLSHGRRLSLLVSAAPIYDGRGAVAGGAWAFADITLQKNLQRELDLRRREAEEANVRKTRFLASVSHDIRTPVNAINLMAEVIRRTADNPALAAQIPQLAQRLQANALSLADLVTDVLDVARFDSGKVDLQESEFLLNELIAEECRHLLPLAQDKGLELAAEPMERPIWLRADRVKVSRVLGNLIGNAIKFTESGGVRVSAALDAQRQVVLRVKDSGVGISAENLGHIFDEFAQLRNPERNRSKGSGLGLTICKRLVDVMGGRIDVESQPGAGSTFTVTLPAACVVPRLDGGPDPAAARSRPEADGARVRLDGVRVLLVEDHSATRETTARILRDEGVAVREAADGRAALNLLHEEPWDAVLLDMMLPDLDGREVLKSIAARRPAGLKAAIVMTGDLTSERMGEVRLLGADAVVGKPVDIARLLDMLHNLRGLGRGPAG